jgi:DNA-binding transcriptional LysR family regulator
MEVHQIRYFLAVCETLNFTRAAEKCNVSQPALSRAVQQLEEEVGGLLFRRERNLTHLTDLGLLLKPRLGQIIDELGGAKRDAKRFLTLERASVTLGVMCTIGPRRFTALLSEFQSRYPGISVRLVEDVPRKLRERLEEGEIDIAIMADSEGFPERFDFEMLYKERFLIGFPPGHRFAGKAAVEIGDVDGETYLRRLNCEFRDYLGHLIRDRGAALNVAYESEREDWILNLVAGGLGICFIPEFSSVYPGVLTRPVVEPEVWRDVCFVSMSGRRLSPAVGTFVKTVREYDWPEGTYPHDDLVMGAAN